MKDSKPKPEWNESKLTGFFDDGTEFEGELKFKGSFRIDGFFKGKVHSDDMLIIGEQGRVEADVHVGFAVVNGEFHGEIRCDDKVEIHDHGRVFGSVMAPRLLISENAHLEATCETTDIPPAAEEPAGVEKKDD
ncbi:MAG: bactofilin family protein [Candidatus Aminicenantales bacterium]